MKIAARLVARPRSGFTLVELVVGMFVLSVGLLASAGVLGYASSYRSLSGSRVTLATMAEDKLEELRAAAAAGSADTVQLLVGGSLTTSIADHADTVSSPYGERFVRRWAVTTGPAQTRDVSVRVTPMQQSRGQQGQLDLSVLIAK